MGKYILKKVSFSEFNETSTKETKTVNLSSNPKKLILKKSADTKEFSTTEKLPKTFKLKRETRNFGVIGDGINRVVGMGENVVGTAADTAGSVVGSLPGKAIGSVAGALATQPVLSSVLGTGIGGTLGSLALGPLALPLMATGGWLAAKGAGKLLKGVGKTLKDDAATRTV